MDRYASRLVYHLNREAGTHEIEVAGEISSLTSANGKEPDRRDSGSGSRRLADEAGTTEMRRYISRYWLYPRRIRAMDGAAVHVLDHSYAHIVLGERSRPSVVTVHDLFPVITLRRSVGGFRERVRNWLLGRVVRGIKQADAWIVATEWLRDQLSEWLGHTDRIHVIPYGVDEEFFDLPMDDRALFRARHEIPESAFVILHVGSVDQRKNVPAIIAVVDQLRSEGIDAWFLQVGGTLTSEQESDLSTRGIANYVTQLGPAAEEELRNAYHAADILLFPSHYEGFGFPVLEAMASGLPAVTSGAGGLTEVAGDAAVIVPGRESKPYVEEIKKLSQDTEWREELIKRGRERAQRFTWSRAAIDTARVYETLV
jgi:glycosyltransferase involved in cell wall biosynthesis